MRKTLLLLFAPLLILSACFKDKSADPQQNVLNEDGNIKIYLAAHPEISATKDTSGLYYQVIAPGTGTHAGPNATVTIDYSAQLLSGVSVNGQTDYSNKLNVLLTGWQIGIPMIAAGGEIMLIVPSRLAYGVYGTNQVPPNSIVIFDITLKKIEQ
ncbi:FKBP-type peptidyl-prolyl cis-trans isomerase [Mucilaginibacter sp. SMC90]|uniref:FKBP-type peptidyl-prolyl cis-trans isomerase n=1 Tax=Mucilaginibacter sp. SMC90 TaxID=2929803 RepID=UPI001FB22C6F|nr:FKBP-type peptidyl-prolyl cis-trans isomerase [Mucilaginibacter sp. SMC90]UOE49978.1 FKBP-type peptidyl-prolyl cis-trans isomerase [Mucilaginibacter sp. SMC90]